MNKFTEPGFIHYNGGLQLQIRFSMWRFYAVLGGIRHQHSLMSSDD
jgi:hypothetical protein